MPGLDAGEIVVGANGHIMVAPGGTAPPDDITDPWGTGWVDLGYATEDGVTLNAGKETNSIRGWQSFYDLRTVVTSRSFRLSFTLQQWNAETVTFALGGGEITEDTPGASYRYTPPAPEFIDERTLGVDWTDGDKHYILVVDRGQPAEAIETNLQRTSNLALPIAFDALGATVPWFLLTDDPAFAPVP